MKKLMIALAAVAMGFAANAAALQWSVANVYVGNKDGTSTTKAASYLVYCFDNATYSQASAASALASKDTSFLSKALNANSALTLNASGKLSNGVAGTGYGNGVAVTGYMVIVDDADPTTAYLTSALTATTGAAGQDAVFNYGSASSTAATAKTPNSKYASNWYSVPEPCSGLLMLVGMGALALRRRRA